ncbi:maleylpyruvate isomerase family mycothiol-dependent enzyme [Smaragdicoccus niigatensis]|uniref:maleylpyruvate isomerase family mycothiol-dependent enzyme n=1 Tax=Smaragdicoccus niigatensis TaxID=359359 RepID=UPI00036A00B3|nr:maleylpyruvate isomerase family mycothiol-dependent enzyme [Smaragdicoccus niigatensis]
MSEEDRIISEIRSERARLVALLETLTPEQWNTPSLCDGWTVSEVVAHMTMPFRTKPLHFATGMARARFDFNRYADRDARRFAESTTTAELVELLRRNIDHPWSPPGGGRVGALSHDVIHGLDFTEPLGLPEAPAERIALVLQNSTQRSQDFFGVDLGGRRLVATDAEVSFGSGVDVEMSAKDILLTITGRSSAVG